MARPTKKQQLQKALKEFANDRKLDFLLQFQYKSLCKLGKYYGLEFKVKKSGENKFIIAKKVAEYGNIQEYWKVLMGYDPLKKQKF